MALHQAGSLAPGTVVADCRIDRLLGFGGMGEVYLATHLRLEKHVALKILPRRAVGNPDAVARFLREAKLAAKINHPNVIKILDVNRCGDDHYILMDYIEGANLADVVKKVGSPLPYRQALRVVQLAARGAAAVHDRGLIHRDIKPANIMLTAQRNVILMDFGLVREVGGSDVTNPGAVLGTPAFMSPEQSRGDPLDASSDVFALGATLYYLLTAKLPHEGPLADVLIQLRRGQLPRPACQVNPYVPKPVSDFVNRAMAPRREDRPKTAAALAAEIKPLLRQPDPRPADTIDTADVSGLKTGPHPDGPPEIDLVPLETVPGRAFLRRAQPYLVGAAAVVVPLALALLLAMQDRKPTAVNDPAPPGKEPEKPVERPGMAYIPAGPVQIGNTKEELRNHYFTVELKGARIPLDSFLEFSLFPPRTEQVPAFWIDKYETTNAEYAKFVEATGHPPPTGHAEKEFQWDGRKSPPGKEQYPVTMVSHADATAYANWSGKKLPTEQQFIRAFRGDTNALYPWGNEWNPSRAVVYENPAFDAIARVDATPRDKSPFGVFNLAGNVREMVRDTNRQDGETWVTVHGAMLSPGDPLRAIAPHYARILVTARVGKTGFRCVHEGP